MTTINAVTSAQINHAEFVRLTVGKTPVVYTFCNASAPITVDGITFANLGALLNVGDVQRDIKATSDDMTIQLTGIDPTNIGIILGSEIKGSLVEVWRGFFDANNQIITTPTQQFFKRYQGIINSVSINEDFNTEKRIRVATCNIACSSMRRILENRLSGMKTNKSNWQFTYLADTSMNRVSEISNQYFDFGKPPQKNTQASETTVTTTSYEPP
ncbi:hypothetical protein UFOVP79_22 [uncultured Caudovirales phage]|uniref:Uncharacterized protein n=1 Tax=uncultured Caudovirales phage TaxID=2100421 RepID=A0A6J5L471_9CAUD|nr:hypothetical protein UFOVP79_22 [uncultured Caudovirales phage]